MEWYRQRQDENGIKAKSIRNLRHRSIDDTVRSNIWSWLFDRVFAPRRYCPNWRKIWAPFFSFFVGYQFSVANHFHISIEVMKFNQSRIVFFPLARSGDMNNGFVGIRQHIEYSSNFLIGYNWILNKQLMVLFAQSIRDEWWFAGQEIMNAKLICSIYAAEFWQRNSWVYIIN